MLIPPDKHSSSSMSHMGLMMCFLVSIVMTGFLLIVGWRWYFDELNRRREFAELSAVVDRQRSAQAAMQNAQGKASTRASVKSSTPISPTPVAVPTPVPPRPMLSLSDLPHQSETGVFSESIPLPDDVEPERLRAAIELQKLFWAAPTWHEKLAFITDSKRVQPMVKEFYEVQKDTEPLVGNLTAQGHFKLNSAEVLLFSYSSPRPGGALDMALVATNGGKFLIDWESYVGASEVSWGQFKRERITQPKLFRVFANQDDYFNFEFSDDKRFTSFHLTSPDGLNFVKGYCERESTIAKTLISLFSTGAERKALTLRLAFPEKAQSDQCVHIIGVLANRWLIVP